MGGKRIWDPRESTIEQVPNEIVLGFQQPGIMAAPHWHAQAEVNYIFRGALDYVMPGYRLRLQAGDIALFWGGLPHRVVDTDDETYFHAIHLPLFHFFRLRVAPEIQQRLMTGCTLVGAGAQAEDDLAFVRRKRYLESGDPRLVQHAVDDLLMRIERIGLEPHRIHEAADAGAAAAEGDEQPGFTTVHRICGYIAEHFRDAIDSADIAVAGDIHPKYAMNLFKRSMGMTLGDYVSLMRLSYAQALLTKEEASILQVAMDSGFGSLSAFNKCFRKKAGMSPSEFRRMQRLAA